LPVSRAYAQESGGSFGGSDFGGGGGGGGGDFGGGGGGGGGWSGGGGSDWGGGGGGGNIDFGSGSSTPGGGGGSAGGAMVGLFIAIAFMVVIFAISQAQQRAGRARRAGFQGDVQRLLATVPASPQAYVAALQLAIDWHERAAVQAVLQRLAASGDLKTRAGLDRLLDETLGEIGRRQQAIRLASYFSEPFPTLPACEARFRQVAATERGRFQVELIRGEGTGAVRDASGKWVAAQEEGLGFVVVTILVASRMPPPGTGTRLDRAGLATVASAMAANTPTTILALEVVWTPAAEDDRMSSAEMQVLFPHLRAIDPEASAGGAPALGRVTCGFCGGVFAAELPTCPLCGGAHRQG
jgi:uncharacterized membrane protein